MAVDTKEFYDALVNEGVGLFVGVPDSLLKDFCARASNTTSEGKFYIAANEGGAVGMACGWHLSTGGTACVYMQNSGEGNAVNPLLSIADPDVYSIPMFLVVGWRGEPGVRDEPQHVKQGKVTCLLLDTIDVPYEVMGDDWRRQVERLCITMREESRPVALVIRKDTFASYPFKPIASSFPMSREEALEVVLGCLGDADLTVTTTGKTSREVFEIRERRGESHDNDFLTVGGMGHTSSIAFGMALGTDANVWCIDGDGSLLMHMGALAVIAQNAPSNFKYVLNNNGAHESVGGQPTVAFDVDVPGILRASGFERVIEASSPHEIAAGMEELKTGESHAMVISTHQGSRADLGRPTIAPDDNKRALMAKIASINTEASA